MRKYQSSLAAAGIAVVRAVESEKPATERICYDLDEVVLVTTGAAGMPNFAGTSFGVNTRISTRPASTQAALYGTVIDGVFVDALAVHYDQAEWLDEFTANWPAGSAAELSYRKRIHNAPRYGLNRAMGAGIRISQSLLRQARAAGEQS